MAPEIVIKAGTAPARYWRDLWGYRELFWFLAWRDLLVRYKQTTAGVAWAVLRPLLSMAVLTVVFGKLAKLPSDGVPYSVLVLTALLPWQFLSNALSESGTSLLSNANLVSKVYFPRMIVPASAIVTALIDFAISAALLGVLMAWHQHAPTWKIVFLPLFVLLALITAVGAGLWAAALVVRFRDVRFVIPFAVQFGFFISPIGYSSTIVPAEWRLIYSLNPAAGIIDGFRWSLLHNAPLSHLSLAASIVSSAALLISGILFFRRVEREIADII